MARGIDGNGQYSPARFDVLTRNNPAPERDSYTREMSFLFKGKRVPEGVDPARIPPGQTLTAPDRWPLLQFGPVPNTDIATGDFKVFRSVANPLPVHYKHPPPL